MIDAAYLSTQSARAALCAEVEKMISDLNIRQAKLRSVGLNADATLMQEAADIIVALSARLTAAEAALLALGCRNNGGVWERPVEKPCNVCDVSLATCLACASYCCDSCSHFKEYQPITPSAAQATGKAEQHCPYCVNGRAETEIGTIICPMCRMCRPSPTGEQETK